MKRKRNTPEQERITRLLDSFGRLPAPAQECVIGYAAGVADTARRYKEAAR